MIYTKDKLEQLRHRWTTTKGKKLIKLIKESRCYLSPVLFREKVKNFHFINDHEVEDAIDLRGASLAGFDFRVPIQEDDDGFTEQIAILSDIHFEGATLKHCNFEGGKIHACNFEDSDLSHAEFKNSNLNDCSFQSSDCTSLNLRGAKLINCNFNEANIKDILLDTTIVDQKTTFGSHLKSEKEGSFHSASIEYKQIKEMYKNSSLHDLADTYHYKEMVAKRRISKKTSLGRWLNFFFGDLLCKYGTSFIRVVIWSFVVIFICAILMNVNDSLYYQDHIEEITFVDSLYFSIVTFTTLGYGDYQPLGWMRFVAAGEAFIGAALMSLFTVIVARNIIRD